MSTREISDLVGRCANKLDGFMAELCKKLNTEKVLNCDETGTHVDGKNYWVHNASTSKYTHLTISKYRGQKGMDEGKILPDFKRDSSA